MTSRNSGGDEDIYVEDGDEEFMDIDEIVNEPVESTKVDRCKKCRRMKFGHPRPYGQDKCKLNRIENDEDLRKDDASKNIKRIELRNGKKRGLSHEKEESVAKKIKDNTKTNDDELKNLEKELEQQDAALKAAKKRDLMKKLEERKKRTCVFTTKRIFLI